MRSILWETGGNRPGLELTGLLVASAQELLHLDGPQFSWLKVGTTFFSQIFVLRLTWDDAIKFLAQSWCPLLLVQGRPPLPEKRVQCSLHAGGAGGILPEDGLCLDPMVVLKFLNFVRVFKIRFHVLKY